MNWRIAGGSFHPPIRHTFRCGGCWRKGVADEKKGGKSMSDDKRNEGRKIGGENVVGNRERESKRESLSLKGNIHMFELPWPPQELSPNYRAHWTKTAKAKKRYRAACKAAGAAAGLSAIPEGVRDVSEAFVAVHLIFFPPDRRHRDQDNAIASMKSGLDGVADAMGVDDRHWTLSFSFAREPVKGGLVAVEVRVS